MLSLGEFEGKYTGQQNVGDTDQNKRQCVGLVEVWMDNLGLPHDWGNAIDLLQNADSNFFEVVNNTPTNAPAPGDIVVLGAPFGNGYGHTGVVHAADINKMTLFQQNDPADSTPHLQDYNYDHCLGWLHPKNLPGTSTQAVTDQQLQDQLNAQLEATSQCQTQLKSANDQNQALQDQFKQQAQELQLVQSQLKELQSKYEGIQNDNLNLISANGDLTKQNQNLLEEDYAIGKLAETRRGIIIDIARALGGIDITLSEDKLSGEIVNRILQLKALQVKPAVQDPKPPASPPPPSNSSFFSFKDVLFFLQLFKKPV